MMGAAAKQSQVSNVKNTLSGWKKFIGRKFKDPQVEREKQFVPYDVVEGPDGIAAFRVSAHWVSVIYCIEVSC